MLKVINGAVVDLSKATQVCVRHKQYIGNMTGDPTKKVTTLWKAGGRFFIHDSSVADSLTWVGVSPMFLDGTPATIKHDHWKEITAREAGTIAEDAGMQPEEIAQALGVEILS